MAVKLDLEGLIKIYMDKPPTTPIADIYTLVISVFARRSIKVIWGKI